MKILWDQNIDGGASQASPEDPTIINLEEETMEEEDDEQLPPSRWFGADYH